MRGLRCRLLAPFLVVASSAVWLTAGWRLLILIAPRVLQARLNSRRQEGRGGDRTRPSSSRNSLQRTDVTLRTELA
jgi:hypothetical protein